MSDYQKSPFLVFRHLLSPKYCEQIVDNLDLFTPDYDHQGRPIPVIRHHEPSEQIIYSTIEPLIDSIHEYYQTDGHRGTERLQFEFYSQGTIGTVHCENSDYLRRKWVKTRDRDLSAILFLSDYNDDPPFDTDYEVYGGKVEFPQHHFGFNPERGTLIVFPSSPHFINAITQVIEGDLFIARTHFAAKSTYMYDPEMFPGDYRSWFKNI